MRLSREDRNDITRDLKHWGYVARKRWRSEPVRTHPIARMMEYGKVAAPKVYSLEYDYEPDNWFYGVNQIVMQMAETDRALLVAHYIDGKDWKMLRKMMGLRKWWEVGRELKAAEIRYFRLKSLTKKDNTAINLALC